MSDYPNTICWPCGIKYGRDTGDAIITVHSSENDNDKCGWCGGTTSLAAPRDFGYPEFEKAAS